MRLVDGSVSGRSGVLIGGRSGLGGEYIARGTQPRQHVRNPRYTFPWKHYNFPLHPVRTFYKFCTIKIPVAGSIYFARIHHYNALKNTRQVFI